MTTPNDTTLTKVCTHCGIEKPATPEYFARQKAGKYGFRADCKECHYARQHNWIKTERGREVAKANYIASTKKWRKFWHEFSDTRDRPDETTTCIQCERDLPCTSEYFHRDDTRRSGFNPVCKECTFQYQREYNQRDEVRRRQAEHSRIQREKGYFTEYYQRPEVKARIREYQQRPEVKARIKARAETPEAIQRRRIKRKLYQQSEDARAKARVRDHRRRNAPGSFTNEDIEAIRKAQGNRCYICHKKLKEYHVDHFIPLALGGTNDPGNLRLACPHCNMSKHAKHPHDLGLLI